MSGQTAPSARTPSALTADHGDSAHAESPWSAAQALQNRDSFTFSEFLDGVRALGAVGTDSVSADDVRTPSALTVSEHPAGGADLPQNSFKTTAP